MAGATFPVGLVVAWLEEQVPRSILEAIIKSHGAIPETQKVEREASFRGRPSGELRIKGARALQLGDGGPLSPLPARRFEAKAFLELCPEISAPFDAFHGNRPHLLETPPAPAEICLELAVEPAEELVLGSRKHDVGGSQGRLDGGTESGLPRGILDLERASAFGDIDDAEEI